MASKDTEPPEILTGGPDQVQSVWSQPSSRDPSRIVPRWLTLWIAEVRLHLNPPMPWVVFLGLDGSGKSSVMAELEKIFVPPLFAGVRVISRHPGFLYDRLLQTPQSANHPADAPVAIEHYGKPSHGIIKSIAKLGVLALDWLVGYWGWMVHQRAKGYLVLFDRHFFLDVSIDPLRYRYSGPAWFARLLGRLLPGPNLVLLLDAPVEILRARKEEISLKEAARQRLAYLELVQKIPNSYVVDVSNPLEQVVNEVQQIILDYTNS